MGVQDFDTFQIITFHKMEERSVPLSRSTVSEEMKGEDSPHHPLHSEALDDLSKECSGIGRLPTQDFLA